ncbi:GNAT family N-acetyltransferase [Pyxidicoccus parkwayensis]|uniref:GNAT family N-acetyltransferase n=1 Tax=Pyxidicoccus parkwayensis TaxID=2813578 RepID=A0ABX7NVV6_9BACT|nr:GNAT family N-acetyltransferase [Pyxidicoccus parkwaysis]QSQ21529.1 GNAT family N-acetyltransferase [Pyxidicoccus parkwaysis]
MPPVAPPPGVPAPIAEPLTREDAASGFRCESEALNRFFRQEAGQNQRGGVSRTWVLRRGAEEDPMLPRVLGYYTLTVGAVQRASAPVDVAKHLPPYPLPVVIIGRLARDVRVRGRGVGEALLDHAHRRALHVNAQVGAVLVIADAKDAGAASFYARHGYRPLLTSVPEGQEWPRRMYLRVKDLRAAFAEDA